MAIQYGAYAQSYTGAGPQSSGWGDLKQGLSSIAAAIPTNEEKVQNAFGTYWSTRDQGMSPTFKVGAGGSLVYQGTPTGADGAFRTGDFNVRSLTEEWNNYRKYLDDNGLRMRPDEYTQFAEAHRLKSEQWGQDIASKFERMKLSGVNRSKIRELIASNPSLMQNLVKMSAISPTAYAAVSDYLVPGKGIVPGLMGEAGNIATAASPLAISGALRAGGAAWSAPKGEGFGAAKKGFLRGATPGAGLFAAMGEAGMKDPKYIMEQARKTQYKPGKGGRPLGGFEPGKREARQFRDKIQTQINKTQDKIKDSEKLYKEAKDKYDKQWKKDKKAGKVKTQRPVFSSSKQGRELSKARKVTEQMLDKHKGRMKLFSSPEYTKKVGMKVIKQKIKDVGVSGLLKEIAEKGGKKAAWKIGGKLAAGGLLKASGIGTLAGLALDAWTVYSIMQILGKTIKEESGGFRAPHKMLLGGDDPTRAVGAQF